MVRSMYPPLDPRLLEARAAALTLAVTHLALLVKYECGHKERGLLWIEKSLEEMDKHMGVSTVNKSLVASKVDPFSFLKGIFWMTQTYTNEILHSIFICSF